MVCLGGRSASLSLFWNESVGIFQGSGPGSNLQKKIFYWLYISYIADILLIIHFLYSTLKVNKYMGIFGKPVYFSSKIVYFDHTSCTRSVGKKIRLWILIPKLKQIVSFDGHPSSFQLSYTLKNTLMIQSWTPASLIWWTCTRAWATWTRWSVPPTRLICSALRCRNLPQQISWLPRQRERRTVMQILANPILLLVDLLRACKRTPTLLGKCSLILWNKVLRNFFCYPNYFGIKYKIEYFIFVLNWDSRYFLL